MSQQIETQIDVTLTERNRMSALFRIILVVPMAIFVASFAPTDLSTSNSNYLSVGFLILPTALAIVVRQIYPTYLHAFNKALLSLQTRVDAYLLLLTDEYPSIEENDVVSVTFPARTLLPSIFPVTKHFPLPSESTNGSPLKPPAFGAARVHRPVVVAEELVVHI